VIVGQVKLTDIVTCTYEIKFAVIYEHSMFSVGSLITKVHILQKP